MSRPTFWHQGKPVRAAGLLLWTWDRNTKLYLMNRYRNRYEDLGGKTDTVDDNALCTAVREAAEESNGKLFDLDDTLEDCKQRLHDHIQDPAVFYNARSKYLLFLVYVDPSILYLPMWRFGKSEETDWGTLPHHFQWIQWIQWRRGTRKLHPRLWGINC